MQQDVLNWVVSPFREFRGEKSSSPKTVEGAQIIKRLEAMQQAQCDAEVERAYFHALAIRADLVRREVKRSEERI